MQRLQIFDWTVGPCLNFSSELKFVLVVKDHCTVTATAPEITLPAELVPGDGRFGSGPSKVRVEALAALAATEDGLLGTSHRRDGVRNVVGRVRDGLGELFGLPDGYEVVLGNGGATAFWDASAACLIESRSRHFVFGEFSSKFATVVEDTPWLEKPDVVESEFGTHPAATADAGIDVYALCQNETSTGVMMPVLRPAETDAGALILVDATSAAGGLEIDPHEFDAYYFSPQKCFGAEGGLWIAALSPAAIERTERITGSHNAGRWIPASLNLNTAIENSRKNQSYNTPSLSGMFLLADTIDWMLGEGGLAFTTRRCRESAGVVYRWAAAHSFATPFVTDAAKRSNTVATIDFDPAVDATAIAACLRANGIVDTEPYRKLGRNQLRIALFPAIETADVETLTRAIDYIIERL